MAESLTADPVAEDQHLTTQQMQEEEMERRTRILTEKGQEQYNKRVESYDKVLETARLELCLNQEKVSKCDTVNDLKALRKTISDQQNLYVLNTTDYMRYLEGLRTTDSLKRITDLFMTSRKYDELIHSTISQIDSKLQECCSSTSRTSSIQARAKAMVAKTRVALAQRERDLKMKQVEIEGELNVLKEERVYEEAKAEMEAYDTISEVRSSSRNSQRSNDSRHDKKPLVLNVKTEDSKERTSRYVASLHRTNDIVNTEYSQPHMNTEIFNEYMSTPNVITDSNVRRLNPHAPEFECRNNISYDNGTPVTELSKFLLRKDLLMTRLTRFDDRPENYIIWKSTFKSVVAEIGPLSCSEELDLLVKWLGQSSGTYAMSIRASSASNPAGGVRKLWQRLDERYGAPEMVEASLKAKLESFPRLGPKDSRKLYELVDILDEISSHMENPSYKDLLSYFNTSVGVIPIVNKLPYSLQEKWTTRASKYKSDHKVPFPPFSFFVDFVRELSRMRNDPGFFYNQKDTKETPTNQRRSQVQRVAALKTTTVSTDVNKSNNSPTSSSAVTCPLHRTAHSLNNCRGFRSKPITIRKKFLRENNICFNCCESEHRANVCRKIVSCDVCKGQHATAMHVNGPEVNGGENTTSIKTACAKLCNGSLTAGKSCAKVVSVFVYPRNRPELKVKMYSLLDDQSNKSLVKPEFFERFNLNFDKVPYTLSTCSGSIETCGRRATDFIVESLDGTNRHELPALTECNQIPDIRGEIPTPEAAKAYSHLKDIAEFIPEIDEKAPILMLIGRDIPEIHHVLDQKLGPRGYPFAQKLSLGWVLIGETCLGKVHAPTEVTVNKTFVYEGERHSIFPPCENHLYLKDLPLSVDRLSHDVFTRTPDDNKIGTSVEDREFLDIMDNGFTKTQDGNWSAPLPFRSSRPRLPNNKDQALKRAYNLRASLKRDALKQQHFVDFMAKIFENNHAEIAPTISEDEECWYLPIFGVYHAKKGQIRVVFDSSAPHQGLSLNSVLLQGPDLVNSLLGVLMRFRRGSIAVLADIQQMFFQFRVHENDRNYLRFFWFKENNPELELTEYRMCSHVFGNSPSPSIAAYGLRKTVDNSDEDVKDFVHNNFYVDDGLASFDDIGTAVDVVQRTQRDLQSNGNLRLHKIASNDKDVLKGFPKEDLAKDITDVEELLPAQRSLGLRWNLNKDCFTYSHVKKNEQLTRRELLSVVNSIFDPLGFLAPIVIRGKVIMRDLMQGTSNWDKPVSAQDGCAWNDWIESLICLEQLNIKRTYLPITTSSDNQEIHIFSDASENAISAVAYTRASDANGKYQVGFVLGKSKVAPRAGHTIPRLELCASVLAVEIAEIISENLNLPIDQMTFYTDSRVVLGYLNNKVRRFYIYVQNRVARILKSTICEQWHYVASEDNPADQGTRLMLTEDLQDSKWLQGPDFLHSEDKPVVSENHVLQSPEDDKEIRPKIQCAKTVTSECSRLMDRFEGIGCWKLLVKVIALLKTKARCVKTGHPVRDVSSTEILQESEKFIIREAQQKVFVQEVECLLSGRPIPRNSPILQLSPFIDDSGLLRVGGRLQHADVLTFNEKHPVILPKDHHVSRLLAAFYHEKVRHQGLHFTEGAIRSNGYWLIGAKRILRSMIGQCVKCRKLRGKPQSQIMASLPEDRITPTAPFSNVGVDVFGPWAVAGRHTRGGSSVNKRWAVLYTCLTTRAIHIEVIEEMSSSCFLNATRRFIAIRGQVRLFRSDRGTNFIGAVDLMNVQAINVEDGPVRKFMQENRIAWVFNSPHSSHMGGVWERLIGVVRRILDSMLAELSRNLTHEVLITFMAEICSIVNSRPLVQVSVDPNNPMILSPMMLLTQKPAEESADSDPISVKDMYKAQWLRVKCLSDMFWRRWKSEFLQTLQSRRKWTSTQRDLQVNDVVLVSEDDVPRNSWPMGVVTQLFPSEDGHVRKVAVKIHRRGDSEPKTYTRPITKLVLLLESEERCG